MAHKYFNPNPKVKYDKVTGKPKVWHTGDCVIRAISCATGMSWQKTYEYMCSIGAKLCCMPNDRKAIDTAMKELGFVKVSYSRGETRDLVRDFARTHENVIAILNLSGHVVCCKDGNYYDTWDCGYKTAYNYWVKYNSHK